MELHESDLTLQSNPCNKTGIEAICVLSPDSICCRDVPREYIPFTNGELIKQGNSAILSFNIEFQDEVEKFIFERIRADLVRNPGKMIKPMREPEEGYDISLFFDENMVKTMDERNAVVTYLKEMPDKMRRVCSGGKMTIGNLVRKNAKEFIK